MKYKLGIDFGTTNTTISYYDSGNIKTLRIINNDYIPSCILYTEDRNYIGHTAFTKVAKFKNNPFYKNIKMALDLPYDKLDIINWSKEKTPEEVLQNYFEGLIDFLKGNIPIKDIEKIVISVPEAWKSSPSHEGKLRLQNIFKNKLKLPLVKIVSEPIAAICYHIWKKEKEKKEIMGNFIVFDMGGGTFDICLVKVLKNGKIEYLDGSGSGLSGIGEAGVNFDTELLNLVFEDTFKKTPEKFYEYYSDFQTHKLTDTDIEDSIAIAILSNANKLSITYFKDKNITFGEIQKAFSKTENMINRTMDNFFQRNPSIDKNNTKVLLIGGFNNFILTKKTIENNLEKHGFKKDNLLEQLTSEDITHSVSYGCAIIASDLKDVEETFVFNIGLKNIPIARAISENEFRIEGKKDLDLLVGGKPLSEYNAENSIEHSIQIIGSNVPDIKMYFKHIKVEKNFEINLGDFLQNIKLSEVQNNIWEGFISVKTNQFQILSLVLREKNTNTITEFSLEAIIKSLIGGIVLNA